MRRVSIRRRARRARPATNSDRVVTNVRCRRVIAALPHGAAIAPQSRDSLNVSVDHGVARRAWHSRCAREGHVMVAQFGVIASFTHTHNARRFDALEERHEYLNPSAWTAA